MHTNFSYMIFVTPFGKAYGCFAIRKISKDLFRIAASFVSPVNSKNWKKKISRDIVSGRLEKEDHYIELPMHEDWSDEFSKYYSVLFTDYCFKLKIPNWAINCYYNDAYCLSLKEDNLPFKDMVYNKNLADLYFEYLYKKLIKEP